MLLKRHYSVAKPVKVEEPASSKEGVMSSKRARKIEAIAEMPIKMLPFIPVLHLDEPHMTRANSQEWKHLPV